MLKECLHSNLLQTALQTSLVVRRPKLFCSLFIFDFCFRKIFVDCKAIEEPTFLFLFFNQPRLELAMTRSKEDSYAQLKPLEFQAQMSSVQFAQQLTNFG